MVCDPGFTVMIATCAITHQKSHCVRERKRVSTKDPDSALTRACAEARIAKFGYLYVQVLFQRVSKMGCGYVAAIAWQHAVVSK